MSLKSTIRRISDCSPTGTAEVTDMRCLASIHNKLRAAWGPNRDINALVCLLAYEGGVAGSADVPDPKVR
jgi:hypothetical protein